MEFSMRAVALTEKSSAPKVVDIPKPVATPGHLIVHVQASSLNGFDISVAAGHLEGMMEYRYPVVIGKDYAGIVDSVGDGVTQFAVGDRVFGVVTSPFLRDGGIGEYLIVNEKYGITKIPAGVEMADAGALGLAGAAAVDALDAVSPKAGQTILIVGATGGVGAIATQYAVAAGANVIATAKPGAPTEFVKKQGAQHVVDSKGDLAEQVKAIAPNGVDAILHLAGDASALPELLAPNGKIASLLGFGADKHPAAVAILASANPSTLDRLAADVAAGRIHVPITVTYSLDEVPGAITAFHSGQFGKQAIKI